MKPGIHSHHCVQNWTFGSSFPQVSSQRLKAGRLSAQIMLVVYLLVLGFSAANPLSVSAESSAAPTSAPAAAPQAGILPGPVAAPLIYDQPAGGVSRTSGGLTITPITAYNLIVDSNVLSPSTYGPSAATLGAQFCNTSGAQLTNVWAYIGNFNPGTNAGTPGIYPVRNEGTDAKFASEHPTLVGATQSDNGTTFSLKHQSGSVSAAVDASRYLGTLDPGQCRTQYWLVTYPRKALVGGNWVTVTGGIKPEDDLWLGYYFWASAAQTAASGPSYQWRPLTMRNEISAMANKIWPNGDNKVPDAYRTAIADLVGWETLTPTGTSRVYPGQTVTSQGIWYDFGNVGAGFDNNFDFVPDRNAWVQPIGDASNYDPGCFRLVRTYGLVIIKLNDGSEMLIPFVDRMYFENIPDNNNGAVGLVYYEYIALDGACTAGLTPYQEVASGYDNEKFNGDFGAGVPPLQSQEFSGSGLTFDKSGSPNVSLGGTITYSLKLSLPAESNTSNQIVIGDAAAGMALVFQENIPAGTQLVPGSVTSSLAADELYSNDNGATWTTTASTSATTVQWWLKSDVKQTASTVDVTVGFQVSVPSGPTPAAYAKPTVDDTACLRLGSGPCFTEDTFTTLVDGPNSLNGYVYADTGVGGGTAADGARNGAEPGIGDGADADTTGVRINLYLWNDANSNGIVDSGEVNTTTPVRTAVDTDGTGYYSFSNLPDGRYAVVVDSTDADIPTGYAPTSVTTLGAALDPNHATTPGGVTVSNLNFGFAPALSVQKYLSSTSPAAEGSLVTFSLVVSNTLAGSGTSGSTCLYDRFATTEGSISTGVSAYSKRFDDDLPTTPATSVNVFTAPEPDNVYATADYSAAGTQIISGTGISMGAQSGKITGVKARVRYYLNTTLTDDYGGLQYWAGAGPTEYASTPLVSTADQTAARNALNAHIGQANAGWLELNLGTANAVTGGFTNPATGADWQWSDLATGNTIQIVYESGKTGSGDAVLISIDAMEIQVTASGSCGSDAATLNPVPLTDQFDNRYLEFVSASQPVSSTAAAGNNTTLTWSNVGPLYPGQTKTITATLRAKTVAASTATVNFDESSGAKFNSGASANNDLMSSTDNQASVTISPPAGQSIAGYIWNDVNNNGWQAPVGYEPQPGDAMLPGVTVTLYACGFPADGNLLVTPASSGYGAGSTCQSLTDRVGSNTYTGTFFALATTTTDANGYYSFNGLNPGFYYTQVTPPAIGGAAVSQTAEPLQNGTGATCAGGCDNSWMAAGVLAANANTTVLSTNFNNLTANEHIYNVNLGYRVAFAAGTASVGDTLFYDWNGNAAQDGATDEGVRDVTVWLYRDMNGDGLLDASDMLVSSTSTDANGKYCFGNTVANCATGGTLPAGNYLVRVDATDPQYPAAITVPSYDPDETGACVICDNLATVALTTTADVLQDFGYKPVGSAVVGDTVFFDKNGNGYQDGAGETGLPNITVWLQVDLNGDGTWVTIKTTSTDASGKYSFSGLANGSYRVMVDTADTDMPKDAFGQRYVPSSAPTVGGDWYSVTIAGGTVTSMVSPTGAPSSTANGFGDDVENDPLTQDADFAFTALGAFGDTVYLDINGNGTQDYNEPGIAGVAVKLCTFSDAGTPPNGRYDPGETIASTGCQTATTNASGKYLFSGLPAGTYVATVTTPVDSLTSNPMTLTGDPEADGVSCATSPEPYAGFYKICDHRSGMTIYAGTNYMGADFGYRSAGVLGDTLWLDSNGNKVVDPGEKGLPGVTVTLTGSGSSSCTPTACTTTTDADGLYLFSGLKDGTYTLRIPKPAGLTNTAYPAGTLFDADSYIGVTVTGGKVTLLGTRDCTLTTGGCDLDADFGYQYKGNSSLSGTICLDAINGDLTNDTFAADPTDQIGVCGADAQPGTSGVGPGEAPFDNVIVHLYIWNDTANAGTIDAGELVEIAAQATDAYGNYAFTAIPDGVMYVVSANAPGSSLELTTQTGDSSTVTAAENERVVENNSSGPDTAAYAVVSLLTSTSAPNVDFAYTSTIPYDFGDLPDSYSTTLQSTPDGARSQIQSGLYLGNIAPDAEENGAASTNATGDGADEDGITFQKINWAAGSGTILANIHGSGYLAGWIDLNHDNKFSPAEMIVGAPVTTNAAFPIDVPAGTFTGTNTTLNARFRLFAETPSFPALAYTGASSGGEVEDYQFTWGLAVDKDVIDPHTVAPGGATSYRIYVANTGSQPLSGITVNDTLPSGFSLTGFTAPAGVTCNGPINVQCSGLALNGGANATIDLTVKVSSSSGTYNNSVTVTSAEGLTATDDGTVSDSDTLNNVDGVEADPATDEDVTVANLQADVAVTKTVSPAAAGPNTTLTYTINVVNNGPSAASNVVVTDALPAEVTFVSASLAPATTPVAPDRTHTWNLGNLASGAAQSFTVTVTVKPNALNNFSNTATVSTSTSDTDSTNNSSTIPVTVTNTTIDLGIVKDDGLSAYTPGSPINYYTITVHNYGPNDATGATVTDAMPAGITSWTWTCATNPNGSCTPSAAGSTSDFSDTINLAAGQEIVYHVVANTNPSYTGSIDNTAAVAAPAGLTDIVPGNNSEGDSDTPDIKADVSISKKVSSATAGPNDSLTYTLDIVSNGPSTAAAVQVSDTIPAGLTFASATPAASSNTGAAYTWNLGNLLPNATRTITVSVTVNPATLTGTIKNTAAVSTTTSETSTTNNSAAADVAVTNSNIDLGVTKDDKTTTYIPGGTLNYTITVHNFGPNAAAGAAVNDALPAGILRWTWTCDAASNGTCTASAPNSTSSFHDTVDLAAGEEIIYHVAADTDPAALSDLTNIASVGAPGGLTDADLTNNTAKDIDTASPQAELDISKSADPTTVGPNGTLTYDLMITNQGPSDAPAVVVSDSLPAQVTFVSAFPAPDTASVDPNYTWSLGKMRPGEAWHIAVTVKVKASVLAGFANTATVTSPISESNYTNNTSTASVTVTNSNIDLGIVKDDGAATYTPGGLINYYTITVHNYGPNAAAGATVSDTLPTGITSWTWTCAADPTGTCTPGFLSSTSDFSDTIDLAAGQEIIYHVVASTDPAYAGDIDNIAKVTAPAGMTDIVPGNNSDNDLDTPVIKADVQITKTVKLPTAKPNGGVDYNLEVVNNGPSIAAGVQVSDTIPAGLIFDSAIPAPSSISGSTYTWNLGTMAPGVPQHIMISVTVKPDTLSGIITNTATVSTTTSETTTANNTSAVDVTVINNNIDLGIVKDDKLTTYTPGQTVNYTITVHNYGPNAAAGAVVDDVLPAGILSWTWICDAAANSTCTSSVADSTTDFSDIINLSVGEEMIYHVAAVTDPAYTLSLINTATVSAPAGLTDIVPGNNSDDDNDEPFLLAELAIVKTAAPTTVGPNGSLVYTLEVTNSGPSTAPAVIVSDSLPAQVTFVSATPAPDAASVAPDYTWSLGDMQPGATRTITLTVKVNPNVLTGFDNTAAVEASISENNYDNNTSTASVAVANNTIDLGIVKDDGASTYTPGSPVNFYTITVHNYGPNNAAGATVTDTLPAGITSWTWTCFSDPTGTCTASVAGSTTDFSDTIDLAAGQEIIYHVVANTNPSYTGDLNNTATVAAPASLTDTTPGNNSEADLDTPVIDADVAITKTVSSATAGPKDSLTYTLEVVNNGPSTATNVQVSDSIPAGLSFASATPAADSGSADPNYTWSLGDLLPGEKRTIKVSVTVNPATLSGGITNTATVSTSTPETIINNNTSSVPVSVTNTTIDLGIVKDDGITTFNPGQTVTYNITVQNYGPNAVTGATVSDALPAGALSWTWSCLIDPTGTCSDGTAAPFSDSIDLAAGQSIVYSVAVVTDPAYQGDLDNTAAVSVPNGLTDIVPENNSDNDLDTPVIRADVVIIKTTAPVVAGPNASIAYTLRVINSGPSTAENVVVSDTIPAGLTFSSATPAAASSAGATYTWNLGAVAPNVPRDITVNVTVNAATQSGTITNTAAVSTSTSETNTNNNTSSADVTVTNNTINLGIVKDDGATTYKPGQTVNYTITVHNYGPNAAAGAAVNDNMPAGILRWTWACDPASNSSCTPSAANSTSAFSDTIDLAVGEEIIYHVAAQTNPTFTGDLNNTAAVTPPAGLVDTAPGNNSDGDIDTANIQADVSITKSVSSGSAGPNDPLTYTLLVVNNGPSAAANVVVSDTIPAGLTVTGSSPLPASVTGDTYTWNLGLLPPGIPQTITVSVTVNPGALSGTINNTASVSTSTPETDTNNNTSSISVTVNNSSIDLGITKDDGVTTYAPGSTLIYTITVVNNGPNDATGATVSDARPAGILSWTWACTTDPTGTCDGITNSTANFSDTIDLAAGGTMVYTVSAVTDPSFVNGSLDNTAVVAPPTGLTDTDKTNDQDSDSDTPVPVVDLALTKDVSPKEFLPGDLLTYTLTVTNNGPSTAINTIVSDSLPVEVAYASSTPAPATTPTAPDRTYTWALGNLLPGQTRVITLKVTVYDWVTQGFSNTATVDSDTSDPVTANNVSSVLIPPTPVELVYFRADRVRDEQVSVQWATETEVNTFGYRLMRAPTRDFSQAVEVGFAPVDVVNKKYEVLDAVPGQGVYWYWLVKVDNNGHEETSDPVMVLNYPAGRLNFLYMPAVGR